MTTAFILLTLGVVMLSGGADLLVRGAASLARRFGLTPLVIGLTVVAFGTSAPELVVSIGATIQGHADIAMGNVVGSNILNIGVILGLAALLRTLTVDRMLLRFDVPFMIVVSVLLVCLVTFTAMNRFWGSVLVLCLLLFLGFRVAVAERPGRADRDHQRAAEVTRLLPSAWLEAGLIVAGLASMTFGSRLFLASAITIAREFGVQEAVIGLTIVAAGTSLPELATSIVAVVRGQIDISIGNVVGSNIFNILGVAGLCAVIRPAESPGIGPLDLAVMVVFAVALLILLRTGKRLQRWEGAVLLGGYVVYVAARWPGG